MRNNKTVTIDIDGILNMTDLSVCVDVGNGRYNGVWVPISLIEECKGLDDVGFAEWVNEAKEITIPEWKATQAGLV